MSKYTLTRLFLLLLLGIGLVGCTSSPTTSVSPPSTNQSLLGELSYQDPTQTALLSYNNNPDLKVPADLLLLLVKEGTSRSIVEEMAKSFGGEIVGVFEYIGLYQLRIPSTTQEELDGFIAKAKTYSFVETSGPLMPIVDKEIKGTSCRILEDVYSDQKAAAAYEMIGLERAWDLIRASGIPLQEVKVGVVDSGIDVESSDGTKGTKIQALDKTDVVKKQHAHGSCVANALGASWDNGGTRGVAGGLGEKLTVNISSLRKANLEYTPLSALDPKNPAHISTTTGQAYLVNTFAEIKKQIDAGAQIINYSQGPVEPGTQNQFDNIAYKKFLARMQQDYPKVLFVAAAGNEGYVKRTDPATGAVQWVKGLPLDGNNYDMGGTKADNLITVGSLNSDGTNSSFTNTATGNGEVTLAAQGTEVALGTNPDGTTYYASGTSFSTPQVAGAAAILKSINPDLTAKEIKDILVKTADTSLTNEKLLPKGVKAQPIDPGVGGRVMRLDKAVLDQIKVKLGNTFDETLLEQVGKISLTARADKTDPLQFTLTANIPATYPTGTDVSLTFNGEGGLIGDSKKHMTSAGNLEWGWVFLDEKNSAQVTVTRADSGACARVSLRPNTIAGTYEGSMHFSFPEFAQFMSTTSMDVPVTITIQSDGTLTASFSSKGSLSYGGNGVTMTTHYTAQGEMKGSMVQEKNLQFTGSYSSTYNTVLPSHIATSMPASYRALLSGTGSGTETGTGTIEGTQIQGTITFTTAGQSTTGTYTATKITE